MEIKIDRPFDYFSQQELPTPRLGVSEATSLLQSEFHLEAQLESLGSNQDQNFLVRSSAGNSTPLGVLKISNPVFTEGEIDLQSLAAERVHSQAPTIRTPAIVDGASGALQGWWETSEGRLHARLISFLEGRTLTGSEYLSPQVVARMGEISAAASTALRELTHPAASRVLQWDLRHADRVIDTLLEAETDPQIRAAIVSATTTALEVLKPLRDHLPVQIGHFDITDDNVLVSNRPGALPDAIIDFGDVTESWAVGELAVTVSSLLHHDGASATSVLPAIRAFHEVRPLSTAEVDAIWSLVTLRGAVLVLSGREQLRLQPDNEYARVRLAGEMRIFEQATATPPEVMARLFRRALKLDAPATRPTWPLAPVLDLNGQGVLFDAGPTSEAANTGAWMASDSLDVAALAEIDKGAAGVLLSPGVPVVLGAPHRTPSAPTTVPSAATLWLAQPHPVQVPPGSDLVLNPHGFEISTDEASLELTIPSGQLSSDTLTLPARTRIKVQLKRPGQDVPEALEPDLVPGWMSSFGLPNEALGFELPQTEPESDVLDRRERLVAEVQEHYFAHPPQIERGWREYLIDTNGRVYLDMVNNVTSVGHAHPRIAEAVSRQLRLLNTNSRFNYSAIADFAERITSTLPPELDTVFFVNSGSEATDLAIRLAKAATGREDIIAMREAYHGWTFASDAVSTSIADNPNALTTRPQWVHTVDAANSYRGLHRGSESAKYGPEAVARIEALATGGADIAGFICEPYFGNAGGVALPDGYLSEIYSTVRRLGGLTIADEVQVGYGRLGQWFWGFQQQNVVPDIVAVAKSIGNGHPLGAVITRKEIADRYRTQGYFFSSTGGSPVSSVVGTTVLDIIQTEKLQENALAVGLHLKQRLETLATSHPIIGAVHGSGLYLGLELVRDRDTLEPATEETESICNRLLELGVFMQPTGDHQNVFKIKPPLCITKESVDYFVDMLEKVLENGW